MIRSSAQFLAQRLTYNCHHSISCHIRALGLFTIRVLTFTMPRPQPIPLTPDSWMMNDYCSPRGGNMNDNKAFLVVGRDHKVIFWSDELAKLTGHAAEDIVGGNMDPIIHPDLRTRHYAGFERAWDDNFVALSVKNPESSLDVPTHCKDGEYRNM